MASLQRPASSGEKRGESKAKGVLFEALNAQSRLYEAMTFVKECKR